MLIAQEDDAIVWELLGHATRIWHIASGQLQLPFQHEPILQAARRIFNYWSTRKAWLVSSGEKQGVGVGGGGGGRGGLLVGG